MTARRRKGGSALRTLLVLAGGVLAGAGVVLVLFRPELLSRLREVLGTGPGATPAPGTPPSPAPAPSPSAPAARPTRVVPSDFEASGESRGAIALVIDDLGYSDEALARVSALPGPLALAVLPEAPGASRAAALARERGWDLLVHLPMEPDSGSTPETLVSVGQGADEVARRLDLALSRLPGAIGVNNHQGSRATADRATVSALLSAVGDRGLFFLDSRTTSATVVPEEARRLGVAFLSRDVFLDDVPAGGRSGEEAAAPEAIAAAWERVLSVVAKKGQAVVLAHPRADSLDFLERALAGLDARGLRLVRASELVD